MLHTLSILYILLIGLYLVIKRYNNHLKQKREAIRKYYVVTEL